MGFCRFLLLLGVLIPTGMMVGPGPAQAGRIWHVTAGLQGFTPTRGCFVNGNAPCTEVRMVYPFYLLDDGHGTRFLVDAGLSRWSGRLTKRKIPPLELAMIPVEQQSWTARDLREAAVDVSAITAVLTTHSHWDHVTGLMDLENTPVWMSEAEAKWIRSIPGHYGHGVLTELYQEHPARTYRWSRTFLSRWFARSADISGDRTLYAVQLDGHTPGNTGYLVHSDRGSLFFIGDAVYRLFRSIQESDRSALLGTYIDTDRAAARRTLADLAAFVGAFPRVRLIPHHDENALRTLQTAGRP